LQTSLKISIDLAIRHPIHRRLMSNRGAGVLEAFVTPAPAIVAHIAYIRLV
jgi:hypothetical protein